MIMTKLSGRIITISGGALLLLAGWCAGATSLDFMEPKQIRTGTQNVALVFGHYNELTETEIDKSLLLGHFKTQPEAFFDWASMGAMDLNISLFFHDLGVAERDSAGACRPHPMAVSGASTFDEVPSLNPSAYQVHYYQVLTTQGCSGSCSSGSDGVQCTKTYSYPSQSGTTLDSCDATSMTEPCETVFLHELLHALGLGYHQNAVQCTFDPDSAGAMIEETWRDCTVKEYGNVLDVLGSGNKGDKVSFGVSSKSRYDLGWLESEQIKVLTKSDSPNSWAVTSEMFNLKPLDDDDANIPSSADYRAAIIRFTDPVLASLGSIWLEYRAGQSFDDGIASSFGGFNSNGIIASHWGVALVDLSPSGEPDDYKKVALQVGQKWSDSASGLELETIAIHPSTGATVKVTFNPPPACVAARPTLNLPGYYGGYLTYLAKGDLDLYKAPENSGWQEVTINGEWIAEYMPYWFTPERDNFGLVLAAKLSARNNDGATCAVSHMTIKGYALPAGWRVDEGACMNDAGGQGTTDMCFTVAVPKEEEHGAYEILIAVVKEENGMESSELYPFWVCVGGFNPWFQSVTNDRSPPWKCIFGNNTEGVEPDAAEIPDRPGFDTDTEAPTAETSFDDLSPTMAPVDLPPTPKPTLPPFIVTDEPTRSPSSAPSAAPVATEPLVKLGPYIIKQFSREVVSCIGGKPFRVALGSDCTYASIADVLGARMERQRLCKHDADVELRYLTGANSTAQAKDAISAVCNEAIDRRTGKSLEFGSSTLMDDVFNAELFNGGTVWNEGGDKARKMNFIGSQNEPAFKGNARRIETFHRFSEKRRISWPEELPNFADCELNAVMCCWVDDGGSDQSSYDNTDVCLVDMANSPLSNHVDGGFSIFRDDKEGQATCHAMAWSNDEADWSSVFRGNALFHISLYEGMYHGGLSRAIPGAPMCGCIEKMPTVTRADCTEIDVVGKASLTYRGDVSKGLKAAIHSYGVKYDTCRGTHQDNDIGSHYERLVLEGKLNSTQKEKLDEIIVGNGNCRRAVDDFIASEGFVRAQDVDDDGDDDYSYAFSASMDNSYMFSGASHDFSASTSMSFRGKERMLKKENVRRARRAKRLTQKG